MDMPGTWEILLIIVVIVLLFGASKLPELARSVGRSMGEFKRGQYEVEQELNSMKMAAAAGPGEVAYTRVQRMARNLNIDVTGKTDDQLLVEIEKKLEKK